MGTWGHRNFENDAAMDFVIEVEDNGVKVINEIIDRVSVLPAEDYLEVDDSYAVLAAIEFVAAAKGKQSEDFPEGAEDWLSQTEHGPLLSQDPTRMKKVIDRVRSNSELRDLWQEEGDEPAEWLAVLSDLEDRIS